LKLIECKVIGGNELKLIEKKSHSIEGMKKRDSKKEGLRFKPISVRSETLGSKEKLRKKAVLLPVVALSNPNLSLQNNSQFPRLPKSQPRKSQT
jgi:hypothetical protein